MVSKRQTTGTAAAARPEDERIVSPDGTVTDGHGEVIPDEDGGGDEHAQRIMGMVAPMTAEEREYATDDADLPLLDFENTSRAKGGNLTDAGFAKLLPGFTFVGYVLRVEDVPCDPRYGVSKSVLDKDGAAIIDPQTKAPMTRKVQEVYVLKGTAKVPIKGAAPNVFGEVKGKMRIPVYARLMAPIAENMQREEELTKRARAKSPNAPAVRIPLEIHYVGQGPDHEAADGASRSGAHLFEVNRIRAVPEERGSA